MSDDEQQKPAGGTKVWTEEEKLGLLLSIMEASGVTKVDWPNTRLPPGRTVKACSVWLDKQHAARKKLRAEAGEDGDVVAPPKTPKTPAKSKKRAAKDVPEGEGDDEEATPKAKKPKTPRKKKEPVKVQAGGDAEADSSVFPMGGVVKAEVEDEMLA